MNIILFAARWGPEHGGINAFNRDFAKALARMARPGTRVICIVGAPHQAMHEDAEACGIEIVPVGMGNDGRMREAAGHAASEWIRRTGVSTDNDIWLGHDVVTGWAALAAQRKSGGRTALIHHMAPYSEAPASRLRPKDSAVRQQAKLFNEAGAIMFAIGPVLTREAQRITKGTVTQLSPGLREGPVQNRSRNDQLVVFAAGRFDRSAGPLKQGRLVAEALGSAIRMSGGTIPALTRPRLTMFGVSPEGSARSQYARLAKQRAGCHVDITACRFSLRPDSLAKELERSNLAIALSSHEGFGLAGLEAIDCQVPLIINEAGGLHAFIHHALPDIGPALIDTVNLDPQQDREIHIKAIAVKIMAIAKNIDAAKHRARDLRTRLMDQHSCSWDSAARTLLDAVQPSAYPVIPAAKPSSSVPVRQRTPYDVQQLFIELDNLHSPELERLILLIGIPMNERPRLPTDKECANAVVEWARRTGELESLSQHISWLIERRHSAR